MTYPNGQRYLYAAQRGLEHEKVDKQISVDEETDYRTKIS